MALSNSSRILSPVGSSRPGGPRSSKSDTELPSWLEKLLLLLRDMAAKGLEPRPNHRLGRGKSKPGLDLDPLAAARVGCLGSLLSERELRSCGAGPYLDGPWMGIKFAPDFLDGPSLKSP